MMLIIKIELSGSQFHQKYQFWLDLYQVMNTTGVFLFLIIKFTLFN